MFTLYYNAYAARDPRFDGVFFVGVTTTKIYCRPICTAKQPKLGNFVFFKTQELAEKEGLRPCLRCRPELAPGCAPIDDAGRIVQLMINRLEEGIIDSSLSIEAIADQFEISARQLRRNFQKELGVSPLEFIQTRRLLLAKQLLAETNLTITEIAFASGFSSLRRFNDAFVTSYGLSPSKIRKNRESLASSPILSVNLSYRPPYDWTGVLNFLKRRAIQGIEKTTDDTYARTIEIKGRTGWIELRQIPEKSVFKLTFSHSLVPVLSTLLRKVRNLLDLSARPDLISEHLKQDPLLTMTVKANPGLRVTGAFCGFELAVRAVLGQQVSVKAATTLAKRLAQEFGQEIKTPLPDLTRLSPSPALIAAATIDDIAQLGITRSRAQTIIELAKAFIEGGLTLEVGIPPQNAIKQLTAIPGIGQWTAHYIAMRALRWTDAFPKEDLVLRNNLGGLTAKQAYELSLSWRPWRSYAVLHIWRGLV